jgi:hypothetical protein
MHTGLWFPQEEINIKRFRRRILWGFACASLISVAPIAVSAQTAKATGGVESFDKASLTASANTPTGTNAQVGQRNQKAGQQNLDTPGALRQKQIADESTQLLALAMDLKSEVDKTNRDMLSIAVIRKANEIEKLAHNVKDKLKQTTGGS